MLDRDHGDIVFHCDGERCREFLESRTSNFESARNVLRRARWQPRQVAGEWKHFCPDCQSSNSPSPACGGGLGRGRW